MQKKSAFKRLMQHKAIPLLIILIVLVIITMVFGSGVLDGKPFKAMFTDGFMNKTNLLNTFYSIVIQIFMMIGLSCILITGNIDLSIAGQATLASLIFGLLCFNYPNLSMWICLLITYCFAIIFGLLNSFLVNRLHLPAFIATIGASSIYSGLNNIITQGKQIQIGRPEFQAIGKANIGGIFPAMFVASIVVLLVFQFILSNTKFGRSMYMAGGNPTAARLCGLDPNKMRRIMFLINSILTVTGGLCWSAQLKMAHPTSITQSTPNMTATSACILGGVAFMGGSGNLIGPLVAVILLNVFKNMLLILNINDYINVVAQGALLLIALIIDAIGEERRRKQMIAAAMAG